MPDVNRDIYNKNYSDSNLVLNPTSAYDKRVIDFRFELIRKYGTGKDVLDLCCGTGSYLLPTINIYKSITGVDFSSNMLSQLRNKLKGAVPANLKLLENDAAKLELPDKSFDFVFSYTSFYHVAEVAKAIGEVGRVLRPGGYAAIEVGNKTSLNRLVNDVQHRDLGWAKIYSLSFQETEAAIKKAGLTIVKRHSYQLLPMYGAPRSLRYLYPLLSGHWKKIMGIQVGGKILDEWISSAWPFKYFSFRHLYELKK